MRHKLVFFKGFAVTIRWWRIAVFGFSQSRDRFYLLPGRHNRYNGHWPGLKWTKDAKTKCFLGVEETNVLFFSEDVVSDVHTAE